MFGSETLEVAIGLAVLFSFLSLFATSLRESIEAWVKQRGKLVHDAIEELFSTAGKADTGAIREFYESIIISPSYQGRYKGRRRNLPSYIPAGDFASALLNQARQQAEEAGAVVSDASADWIGKVSNSRLADLLRVAYQTAGNDPEKARQFLEQWFDGQMERVSGWYKRRTHAILLAIGFASAALLNIDGIVITQHLYRNDALRQLIVARAEAAPRGAPAAQEKDQLAEPPALQPPPPAKGVDPPTQPTAGNASNSTDAQSDEFKAPREALRELTGYGFPIGWAWKDRLIPAPQCALRGELGDDCALGAGGIALMALGWVLTMFAISLGAPFWFDLLNKFMVIRSTVKPFEKSQPEGSEDRQPGRPAEIVVKTAPSEPSPPPGNRP
jgi:hypothetical protein